MKKLFKKNFTSFLIFLKNFLLSNPKLRSLLYEIHNKEEFGNLYEHEKMLADSVRINIYKKAIEKHIDSDDIIVDLGTGSGILAFFAAKQNPKKIYAIDHSDFIAVAEKIAQYNGIQNIEFIQTNSRNFKPEGKVDVILHEQIGDYLFNENMVDNILDLKQRVLKPEGKIIPAKFELFLEPVCLLESYNIPFIYENDFYGIDFGFLRSHFEPLQEFMPEDYKQEWLDSSAVKHFLCEPEPILYIDLEKLNSAKDIAQKINCLKQVKNPGYLDAFCLYFKVLFDDEIFFDTSPSTENTHWGNCFFRIESRKCYGEETIDYNFRMKDLFDIKTWSVSINYFGKGRE